MIVARIGDPVNGICMWPPPPSGPGPLPGVGIITSGNPQELSGGMPVARIGDMVVFPIGPAFITSGTPQDISAGMPIARAGDIVIGPLVTAGIIVGGMPDEISM